MYKTSFQYGSKENEFMQENQLKTQRENTQKIMKILQLFPKKKKKNKLPVQLL